MTRAFVVPPVPPFPTGPEWRAVREWLDQLYQSHRGMAAALQNVIGSGAAIIPVGGPGTSIDSDIAVFDGTGGKLLKDGGATVASLATKTYVDAQDALAIAKAIGTTKGDLIGFTAASTPARHAVGANTTMIIADSTQADGWKWATQVTTISWQKLFDVKGVNGTGAPPSLAVADVAVGTPADANAFDIGVNFVDTVKNGVEWSFLVPDELDVSLPILADVYYRILANPAGTTDQVELGFDARIVGDTQLTDTGGTAISTVLVAKVISNATYAAKATVRHQMSTVFAGGVLAANKLVKGTISRDARVANVNDTYANTTKIMGIKFQGGRLVMS